MPTVKAVRLSGGRVPSVGRVEVDYFGNGRVWGSVCDNGWSLENANVVCRQLGYSQAIGAPIGTAFGEGICNISHTHIISVVG